MSISLVLLSSINHKLCEFAIHKTLQTMPFDEIIIFSDKPLSIEKDYTFIEIPSEFGWVDYCVWCLKKLYDFIKTDHLLIIQHDGMATKSQYWTDKYLEYDYIGAPFDVSEPMIQTALVDYFDQSQFKDKFGYLVGNGGFSLRSMRLLEALQDETIDYHYFNEKTSSYIYGEDFQISVIHKEFLENKYKIKFGPVEIALNFSSERLCDQGYSFGFHGFQNIPWYLSEEDCIMYMRFMKPNYDQYRLNRLAGFMYERGYHAAMQELVFHRNMWSKQ